MDIKNNKYLLMCGDSIKILKTMEDDSIELIVTDPPYGVGLKFLDYEDTFENWKILISSFVPEAVRVAKKVIFPVCTFPGQLFLMSRPDGFPKPKWRLCWYKGSPGQRTPIAGFQDWEELLVYGRGFKPGIHDYFKVVPDRKKGEFGHPCPKPLGWAVWLIERFSKEGDLVMDPFMGSGTVGVASKMLNRIFIGVDISQEYVDIAKRRMEVITE